MFVDIGGKLKTLAKVIVWLGIIGAVIGGIVLIAKGSELRSGYETPFIIGGIALMIVGPLLSWIGSLFIYGFGELVERTCMIDARIRSGAAPTAAPAAPSKDERKAQLDKLLQAGLITEEEYKQKLNELRG